MHADMREALDDRQHLIERRASSLADAALADHAPWTRALGPPPTNPRQRQARYRQVRIVAACRDRHGVSADDAPLGLSPISRAQRADAARSYAALLEARRLALQPGSTIPSSGRANTPSPRAPGL